MKGHRRMLKPFVLGSRRLSCFKLQRKPRLFAYLHYGCSMMAVFKAQRLDFLQT